VTGSRQHAWPAATPAGGAAAPACERRARQARQHVPSLAGRGGPGADPRRPRVHADRAARSRTGRPRCTSAGSASSSSSSTSTAAWARLGSRRPAAALAPGPSAGASTRMRRAHCRACLLRRGRASRRPVLRGCRTTRSPKVRRGLWSAVATCARQSSKSGSRAEGRLCARSGQPGLHEERVLGAHNVRDHDGVPERRGAAQEVHGGARLRQRHGALVHGRLVDALSGPEPVRRADDIQVGASPHAA